jgi:hypothetical protein
MRLASLARGARQRALAARGNEENPLVSDRKFRKGHSRAGFLHSLGDARLAVGLRGFAGV